jgi:hypothetical protein
MKHITALLIKFLMTAVLLSIVLGIMTDLSFGNILYLSVAVTVIAYVIGDLLILSVANNTVTTLADLIIVFFTVYLYNILLDADQISVWDAIASAIVIGAGEWFFHKYAARRIHEKDSI